ncbi:hypothetical protein HPP92_001915 [Vanilla planifolia]|uniref:DUF7392 domain-containing protein n=1 Tax=Vanilla planifolia TaxID=51239 RepID=A0A835SDN8_VANPL|nr:hypothetical protein HPP92_001915 [Vanilla planifolia]
MKCFSFQAEDLGCLHNSVMKSVHGNLVVWYGAWIKRSEENRRILYNTLLSAIQDLSHLGILLQHGFYDVYAGESNDGQPHARFSSGDAVLLCGMVPVSNDTSELLCLHGDPRSGFRKAEGSVAGACLQCRDRPMVAMLHVWKSLQACYSWLIASDYRKTIRPYISNFINDAQFDVFRVIYVSSDDFSKLSDLTQSKCNERQR